MTTDLAISTLVSCALRSCLVRDVSLIFFGKRSKITLSAKLERYRILILEFVPNLRFGIRGLQHSGAGEFLIEVEAHRLGGECGGGGGSPARDYTELRDVVIRVAAI